MVLNSGSATASWKNAHYIDSNDFSRAKGPKRQNEQQKRNNKHPHNLDNNSPTIGQQINSENRRNNQRACETLLVTTTAVTKQSVHPH